MIEESQDFLIAVSIRRPNISGCAPHAVRPTTVQSEGRQGVIAVRKREVTGRLVMDHRPRTIAQRTPSLV